MSESPRLRRARPSDAAALEAFDIGAEPSPWLDEVREIVSGLLSWLGDPSADELEREVVVLELNGEILGVSAHEAVTNQLGQAQSGHRYLMVTAVRADHQRSGLATLLVESVVADLQASGVRFVTWLVHPQNLPSVQFSRRVFPEADETAPPEDRPYLAFTLTLA